ncbi:BrnT family toxin [Moraxella bovis]|uniref:BrnT family toxin n=1 Tax=Moraxella bovis TaxID=476 RepID=A0A2Z4R643_MORBO|nr:BrnT family toxin [Moraxella bovis]AWY19773.1 BrnT family toxin [Moraxella bovis]UYZ75101.1 BrnT family toxin [Moraxella bovis]UYZ78967.1 BrnT family toxin [Moraxella bovis]UYZ80446.1 BrnT family toxin [Moraxella bovis]UYZ87450.1 BrnT family toxin [Moraxella bovis]
MPILFKHGIYFYWNDNKFKLVYDNTEVSFDEVVSVFDDPYQLTNIDSRFDYDELRMRTVGMSNQGRLLVVAWVQTSDDEITIITVFKPVNTQLREYQNAR